MTTTLGQISLPDKEIEHVFNSHDALSQSELVNVFQTIINKISMGLESIHLATFTLEQQVIQDDYTVHDLEPLENSMIRMEPLIHVLSDLSDIILNKGEQSSTQQQAQQIKITRIQSEWSSLQHFLASVKKQLITNNNQKELTTAVELLLLQIDDISTMIFDFQEKKHASAIAFPTSSTSDSETSTFNLDSSSEQTSKWVQTNKDDQLMIDIDTAFEPLLQSIEQVYHRINSMPTVDTSLNRRFEKVKEKWELLQYERDELKFEHKEDRWLAVFRRVADQVDVMIDGLDRSVVQCYTLINQTREWHASQSTSTSTFDKFSKSFLRSFHHQTNNTTHIPPPVDKEKFKSIEKSFEAKYKYYTPSIDRMLGMLGNGIAARASRDNSTSQRHDSMIQRWNNLKEVMDELRMRDLVETERIISSTTSTSSAASTSSSPSESRHGWKGIRYRTPEPSQQQYDNNRGVRSITPNSGFGRNSLGRSSPRRGNNVDHQSLLRGSLSDSSSVGSSPPQQQQTRTVSRQTKTPRPTRNGSATIKRNNEDFYDEDERYYGVDLMKNTARPPSSNNMRTNSRSQSVERPLITTVRSKTPNPPTSKTTRNQTVRSKSSMGDLMTNRVMSPSSIKRSITPSLIPRPKTPKEDSIRSPSPMIPRPRSQARNNQMNKPPPVPPIPKYVISHENDYASYRDPVLRKKQSMPALHHRSSNTTMEISFNEDSVYHAEPKDPLDVEVGQIVNASPISIKCQKAQPGRYYFGNELSMSSMGGKKMYTCKLMTYGDRRGGQFKNNKVLIRVGGGWQDLEFFLLEHSSLMASDVVVRSFQSDTGSWRN